MKTAKEISGTSPRMTRSAGPGRGQHLPGCHSSRQHHPNPTTMKKESWNTATNQAPRTGKYLLHHDGGVYKIKAPQCYQKNQDEEGPRQRWSLYIYNEMTTQFWHAATREKAPRARQPVTEIRNISHTKERNQLQTYQSAQLSGQDSRAQSQQTVHVATGNNLITKE